MRMGIEIESRLPQEPTSVAKARRALEPLKRRLDPDTFETLRLLVSELVINSVLHGRAENSVEMALAVRTSREKIRVEVADAGQGFEASPRAELQDDGSGGWGLHLVETLSDRWGTERDGHMVWLELGVPGGFASRRAT